MTAGRVVLPSVQQAPGPVALTRTSLDAVPEGHVDCLTHVRLCPDESLGRTGTHAGIMIEKGWLALDDGVATERKPDTQPTGAVCYANIGHLDPIADYPVSALSL